MWPFKKKETARTITSREWLSQRAVGEIIRLYFRWKDRVLLCKVKGNMPSINKICVTIVWVRGDGSTYEEDYTLEYGDCASSAMELNQRAQGERLPQKTST